MSKENLRAALHSIADLLMCDEDNDNPCGTREGDPRPGELCNPCAMRYEALEALDHDGSMSDSEAQALKRLRRFVGAE